MIIENSFEGYIGFFIFYIILIDYITFMDPILIFESNWFKRQFPLILIKKYNHSQLIISHHFL